MLVKDLLTMECQTVTCAATSMYVGKKSLIDNTIVNICIPEDSGKVLAFTTYSLYFHQPSELS